MSERLDERLRRAARTYRRLGNHTAEGMFLEAADTICELQADNAKLRELAAKMAEALRVGGEWCDRECIVVFGCDGMDECPIAKELRELGVEVDG